MKICVWDDHFRVAEEWATQIRAALSDSGVEVHAAKANEIEKELGILHRRRRCYLDPGSAPDIDEESTLDDTAILIVDNDLFGLSTLNDLSAETVADRVGVYTDCAYIVVLNLNLDVDFDLTLLGHPESKADLHTNDRFVADLGLWRKCPREDGAFRPWHWPLLPLAAELYDARVKELVALLKSDDKDVPILEYFGFDDGSRRRLSRAARAFLHPKRPAREVSFIHFIDGNAQAVSLQDGAKISANEDERKIARIGARRIAKWLERYVVGPQDVLIDLPHLIERMPFVMPDGGGDDVASWNTCAMLDGEPEWLEARLGTYRFRGKHWMDRPVFWTHPMETQENLAKLLNSSRANPAGLVFCEDSSAFHRAEMCDPFVAAHNSMSDSRFVRWFGEEGADVRYGPLSRLAM